MEDHYYSKELTQAEIILISKAGNHQAAKIMNMIILKSIKEVEEHLRRIPNDQERLIVKIEDKGSGRLCRTT